MNRKGFTLVELLAVIVILAVIALIAVPMILNIIETSKLGAMEDSAYGLIDAAGMYYASNLENMPTHSHIFPDGTSAGTDAPLWGYAPHSASHDENVRQWYNNTGNTGSSQSHNNIQAYVTVYMYKRVS